ncbi:hypothetical protein EDD18DRAFT_1102758 [Armillaria luteobubalina]|uniref:Uncharacterized protein n=1 Tax=Armillaria luteobubalina TaxID=153913 RepID=A0AA39UR93_9AGAR|nr:hypothetical protein EDD18DRAFT_1102758 [Armillaria luteobubalina]
MPWCILYGWWFVSLSILFVIFPGLGIMGICSRCVGFISYSNAIHSEDLLSLGCLDRIFHHAWRELLDPSFLSGWFGAYEAPYEDFSKSKSFSQTRVIFDPKYDSIVSLF